MKATVQYDDYKGTTAADSCDLFIDAPGQMTQTIFNWFSISLDPENYQFVGISVNTTRVEEGHTTIFLRELATQRVVKVVRYSIPLQTVLDLFKRFEFQVGRDLDDIDERSIEEVDSNE